MKPHELVDAVQDRVHKDSGFARRARSKRATREEPMQHLEDQPAPTQEETSQEVAPRLLALSGSVLKGEDFARFNAALLERVKIGQNRYGTVLKSFNGRNALVDAAQEALDGCQYLTQKWMECEDQRVGALEDLLAKQIEITADLLALLGEE